MKTTTTLLIAAAVTISIATGCSRTETEDAAPSVDAPATAVDTNAAWSPEVVPSPAEHTPDDGHDHSAHDHAGHNH